MAVTSANRYLTRSEMEGNAEYIAAFFSSRGWTINAIAAMLGNMESESTINPGIYENLDMTADSNGFGLVQWTPKSKYQLWASSMLYDYDDIFGQCQRIIYEVENGLQWIPTDEYALTFTEFTLSEESPEYLAKAFLYNYERPADLNQPNRSTQARRWYEFIGGSKNKSMSKLLLYYAGTKRRF